MIDVKYLPVDYKRRYGFDAKVLCLSDAVPGISQVYLLNRLL